MRGPAITRRAWNCLKRKHWLPAAITPFSRPVLQVSDEQGTWYFIGWYDKVGVPYGGTISAIDADTTLYGRWDFQATPESPSPIPGDGRFMVIKEPDQTSVTVGDPITWTITIASMTDETLTLDVTDKLEGVTLTDEEGKYGHQSGYVSKAGPMQRCTPAIRPHWRCEPEDREHRGSHGHGTSEDPRWRSRRPRGGEAFMPSPSRRRTWIYTGGTGYSGVLDDAGDFVGSTGTGLPEQVITSICPTLWKWLTSHGVDLTQAANLADYLSFYYYDQETGAAIRRWDLMDQGVY